MPLLPYYDDSSDEEEVEPTVGIKRTHTDTSSVLPLTNNDNAEKKLRDANDEAISVPIKADDNAKQTKPAPRTMAFEDAGVAATSKATRRAGNAFFKLQQDNRQIRMKVIGEQTGPTTELSSSSRATTFSDTNAVSIEANAPSDAAISAPESGFDAREPLGVDENVILDRDAGNVNQEEDAQVSNAPTESPIAPPDFAQQEAYAQYMEQYAAAYKQYMGAQGHAIPPQGLHMSGPMPPYPYPYPYPNAYPQGYYPFPTTSAANSTPQDQTSTLLANAPASFDRKRKQAAEDEIQGGHTEIASHPDSGNLTEVKASNLRGGGWDSRVAAAVEAAQQATHAKKNAPTIQGRAWHAESGSVVSVSSSRLHKGKNQIHVLAQQAAANALAIQEAKVKGEKTKRQVWAKYGMYTCFHSDLLSTFQFIGISPFFCRLVRRSQLFSTLPE